MSRSRATAIEPTEVSKHDRHDLLSSERRRRALAVLVARDGAMALTPLAAAVAQATGSNDVDADESAERTAIELHHIHLPKLAAAGAIDYDPAENRVTEVHDCAEQILD